MNFLITHLDLVVVLLCTLGALEIMGLIPHNRPGKKMNNLRAFTALILVVGGLIAADVLQDHLPEQRSAEIEGGYRPKE